MTNGDTPISGCSNVVVWLCKICYRGHLLSTFSVNQTNPFFSWISPRSSSFCFARLQCAQHSYQIWRLAQFCLRVLDDFCQIWGCISWGSWNSLMKKSAFSILVSWIAFSSFISLAFKELSVLILAANATNGLLTVIRPSGASHTTSVSLIEKFSFVPRGPFLHISWLVRFYYDLLFCTEKRCQQHLLMQCDRACLLMYPSLNDEL